MTPTVHIRVTHPHPHIMRVARLEMPSGQVVPILVFTRRRPS